MGVCGGGKARERITHTYARTRARTPREGAGRDRERTSASRAKVETGILVVAHLLPAVGTYFNLSGT